MSDLAQTPPPSTAPAEGNLRDLLARAHSDRGVDPVEAARLAEEAVRNLKGTLGDPSQYRRHAISQWVAAVAFLAWCVWLLVGTDEPFLCLLVVAFAAVQVWRGVRDWQWANALQRWLG
jgi:hypothetical protein